MFLILIFDMFLEHSANSQTRRKERDAGAHVGYIKYDLTQLFTVHHFTVLTSLNIHKPHLFSNIFNPNLLLICSQCNFVQSSISL